jgi:hypothetical protein
MSGPPNDWQIYRFPQPYVFPENKWKKTARLWRKRHGFETYAVGLVAGGDSWDCLGFAGFSRNDGGPECNRFRSESVRPGSSCEGATGYGLDPWGTFLMGTDDVSSFPIKRLPGCMSRGSGKASMM